MLELAKKVLEAYKPVIAKFALESNKEAFVKKSMKHLFD